MGLENLSKRINVVPWIKVGNEQNVQSYVTNNQSNLKISVGHGKKFQNLINIGPWINKGPGKFGWVLCWNKIFRNKMCKLMFSKYKKAGKISRNVKIFWKILWQDMWPFTFLEVLRRGDFLSWNTLRNFRYKTSRSSY